MTVGPPSVLVVLSVAAVVGGLAALPAAALAQRWIAQRDQAPRPIVVPRSVQVGVLVVIVALVAWRWGSTARVLPYAVLCWGMLVASVVDLRTWAIPNALTLRLPLVLLPLLAAAAVVDGRAERLGWVLVGAVALPGALLATSMVFLALRGSEGIGLGDIKLAVSIGAVLGDLGLASLLAFALATFASAALAVIALIMTGRVGLADRIPFGPYLAAGIVATIIGGDSFARFVGALVT
jgi:leader peptidase (prepilin peptidase) / N-methyltransferase